MALSKPILNHITSFDVTENKNISFVVSDGDKPVRAVITITLQNTNNSKKYFQDISSSTTTYTITLPSNTLTGDDFGNDKDYTATVSTYNYQGQISDPSNTVYFHTYTAPVVDILSPAQVCDKAKLTAEFSYEQNENELINYYNFRLLNSLGTQLAYSQNIYYEKDKSLKYTFSTNLENNVSYIVQIGIVTVGGTEINIQKTFTVQYIPQSDFFPLIVDTSPLCKYGYITIQSEIVAFDGEAYPDPPTYIDNTYVSLTKDGSYVVFDKEFEVNGDFAMAMKFNSPVKYLTKQYGKIEHSIFEMRQKAKTPYMIINMIEDFADSGKIYAEICVVDSPFYYRAYTDSITKATNSQDYKLLFKRINGLYDVELKVVDKDASTTGV